MAPTDESPRAQSEEGAMEIEAQQRPGASRHASTQSTSSLHSPLRHHQRQPSTPRQVKETLNAHSEYSGSSDDGQWRHRINQYTIKQEIGRGSFGAVHLAVDQNGTEYAIKEFSKTRLRKRAQSHVLRFPPGARRRPGHLGMGRIGSGPFPWRAASNKANGSDAASSLDLIREEIAIMKKLNHPNLVALYEVLDDPADDSLYMVLEMCKKGVVMQVGFDDRKAPYDEEQCRHFFRDLILGIEYLHAQGVVHRDIKPDNCLITHDDVLKVVDFGVSEMFEKTSEMLTAKSAGSPAFLPPEVCVIRHGDISGKAADIWSMGVTLYCLCFGRIPFEKHAVLELYDAIRFEDAPIESDIDPDLHHLFRRLLEKDPNKRIEMGELRTHPWVTKGGEDPLLTEEENTANLVEPPTEEEMQSAITGNFRHLLTVMRAVKRFKHLAGRGRCSSESYFGQSPRLVQPPLPMSPRPGQPTHDQHRGTDGKDRRSAGPRHDSRDSGRDRHDAANADDGQDPRSERSNNPAGAPADMDGASDPHETSENSRAASPDDGGSREGPDPQSIDVPMLNIGPGGPAEGPSDVVSQSPVGTDVNIYETAYREAVSSIMQAQGESATVYLTRQAQGGAEDAVRCGFTELGPEGDRPKVHWGTVLEKTRAVASFGRAVASSRKEGASGDRSTPAAAAQAEAAPAHTDRSRSTAGAEEKPSERDDNPSSERAMLAIQTTGLDRKT